MIQDSVMHTSDPLPVSRVHPAISILLIVILSSVLVFFTTSLDAQNRKPSFSQLDFDHTVRQKPKETPTPEPLNPLERVFKEAKGTDNRDRRREKEPMSSPLNKDQKSQ